MQEKEKATQKAKDLVRMAVAKAALLEPLSEISLKTTPSALVVGGGISGMTSALNLANQGFEVHIVEKTSHLGGIAKLIGKTWRGNDVGEFLNDLIGKVTHHPLIKVYLNTQIKEVNGYVGNFKTTLFDSTSQKTFEVEHGVAIIAIGARPYTPEEYLYKKDGRVFTLLELEDEIRKNSLRLRNAKNIVFIQCVGSRDEKRPYCSRFCCAHSLKLGLELKKLNPDVNIYVLYRDIRTYGFIEQLYENARKAGIVFIHYEPERKPQVKRIVTEEKDILLVKIYEPLLGQEFNIQTDLLALAVATISPEDNQRLSQLFKVPLTQDGFFLEAHMKLRPVDFATEGVFMCGLCHFPKFIDESIAQAEAAASRATTYLTKEALVSEGITASIDPDKCSGCKLCIGVCPYEAISFDEKRGIAVVNEMLCKGCGCCAASCPSSACTVKNFRDENIIKQIEALVGVV